MSRLPSVLVVDDDPGVVAWLCEALGEEGFAPRGETSARKALERLRREAFDLVVSDLEMPELRGLDLLREVREIRPTQAVLLITAFGSIDLAVEAVRAGAVDFIAKPFRIEVLVLALRRALRERQLRHELRELREAAHRGGAPELVARSPAMQRTLELLRRAARSQLPVLLTGESGVGKGALARHLHAESARRAERFVHLNCAALPPGLAEAELFGVRRGAFTDAREDRPGVFEQAHGGSLFLDEIGELLLDLQPKLLEVLESNQVRPLGSSRAVPAETRVIAATNRDLERAVHAKQFRLDLFHRLNVLRIEIPPLRERREDIPWLADQALEHVARRSSAPPLALAEDALARLCSYAWPGNVRELINAIERAATLADDEILRAADFDFLGEPNAASSLLDSAVGAELTLDELERRYVALVLQKTGGHKARAARILGLDRRTLYRKAAALEEPDD